MVNYKLLEERAKIQEALDVLAWLGSGIKSHWAIRHYGPGYRIPTNTVDFQVVSSREECVPCRRNPPSFQKQDKEGSTLLRRSCVATPPLPRHKHKVPPAPTWQHSADLVTP